MLGMGLRITLVSGLSKLVQREAELLQQPVVDPTRGRTCGLPTGHQIAILARSLSPVGRFGEPFGLGNQRFLRDLSLPTLFGLLAEVNLAAPRVGGA